MPSKSQTKSKNSATPIETSQVETKPVEVVLAPVTDVVSEPVVETLKGGGKGKGKGKVSEKKASEDVAVTPVTVAPATVAPVTVATVAPVVAKVTKGSKKSASVAPVTTPEVVELAPVKSVKVAKVAKVAKASTGEVVSKKSSQKASKKSSQKASQKASKKDESTEASATATETAVEGELNSNGKQIRSFKVQLPGAENYEGRFTGLTPYQAANKALSKYYRENKQPKKQIVFSIRESTRGSKRSTYTYNGRREKLKVPVEYAIKDGRTIVKNFKNRLVKVKKGDLNLPQTIEA